MVNAERAANISERLMKEATKEAEVKSAATKAGNCVSSDGTLSAATAASTTVSAFAGDPTYNSSVVGVARRIGYT